jgi:squalene-hopene/tetraprenyl-beta-curcumene cyclase
MFDSGVDSTKPLKRDPGTEQIPHSDPHLPGDAAKALEEARDYLFSVQHKDAHWCAELESNVTITSEYVFMCQALGLEFDSAKRENIVKFLVGLQKKDGSFGIADLAAGDISTTAETYLALRILGVSEDSPVLKAAQKYILSEGGLREVRIFTRIFFAMFGLMPWKAIPAIPPEFVFMPSKVPVNIYRLSSWARGTMVPLFIIAHYRPVYALPNGKHENNPLLDHLWKRTGSLPKSGPLDSKDKEIPYSSSLTKVLLEHGLSWRTVFTAADSLLRLYERGKVDRLRELALNRCEKWVLDHQEPGGDWAGIFPPMINGVLALTLRGYPLDSDPVKKGIEAIERFGWIDQTGFRIQACVSPVWDTALSTVALCDSTHSEVHSKSDPRLKRAMDWIMNEQILVDYGDWKVYNPKAPSGGWAFEYANTWYPDVDDTAAVLLALLKQDAGKISTMTIERGMDWVLSMQNEDGGWAAFDVDNDRLYLNEIPFSDMDSLCDTSSPDVTGRVLEAIGLYRSLVSEHSQEDAENVQGRLEKVKYSVQRGIEYLRKTQESQGSWFGRWGVNYVYGTSHALCGLSRAGVPATESMIKRALGWLKDVQHADGAWGEGLESYADKKLMGQGPSCASQSAWGLMGLLAYLPATSSHVQAGARWLVNNRKPASSEDVDRHFSRVYSTAKDFKPTDADSISKPGQLTGCTWRERQFTGTGFPNHFFLRYHFYRHYFPMMALGRYVEKWRELQE